jgi:hypothetical protein
MLAWGTNDSQQCMWSLLLTFLTPTHIVNAGTALALFGVFLYSQAKRKYKNKKIAVKPAAGSGPAPDGSISE